jgi:hypothetical protein
MNRAGERRRLRREPIFHCPAAVKHAAGRKVVLDCCESCSFAFRIRPGAKWRKHLPEYTVAA